MGKTIKIKVHTKGTLGPAEGGCISFLGSICPLSYFGASTMKSPNRKKNKQLPLRRCLVSACSNHLRWSLQIHPKKFWKTSAASTQFWKQANPCSRICFRPLLVMTAPFGLMTTSLGMTVMSYLFFSSLKTGEQKVSTASGLRRRGCVGGFCANSAVLYRDVNSLRFQRPQGIQEPVPFRYINFTLKIQWNSCGTINKCNYLKLK